MVSKIDSGFLRNPLARVTDRIKANVIVRYIPGHSRIPFNERADHLAGDAVPMRNLKREMADIMADLRLKAREWEEYEQNIGQQ